MLAGYKAKTIVGPLKASKLFQAIYFKEIFMIVNALGAVAFNFSKQNFTKLCSHIIISRSPHSGHASFWSHASISEHESPVDIYIYVQSVAHR